MRLERRLGLETGFAGSCVECAGNGTEQWSTMASVVAAKVAEEGKGVLGRGCRRVCRFQLSISPRSCFKSPLDII